MALTSMLSLVQAAAAEMNIPVPPYIVGNTAQDSIQLYYLINAVGNELLREYEWGELATEYRFYTESYPSVTATVVDGSRTVAVTTDLTAIDVASQWMVIGPGIPQDTYLTSVDSAIQITISNRATETLADQTISVCRTIYNNPTDFDRPVDRTEWNKSNHWEMIGPETQQQWEWLKSGYISTGPRQRFTRMSNSTGRAGASFQIWPPQTTTLELGWNYISGNWASNAAGAPQTGFQADSDTCIYPNRLMILGLMRKYFAVKGFAPIYDRDYQRHLDIAKASNKGSPTLSFAPRINQVLIGVANLPDSGYGT